ncbi:hypothetical protein CONLIGDRAFT_640396 [Coniochaeta ligniaria NRRL 30616]|uniref:Uncharacterized protein n=1 Tax=Coniochaeta ligniaria NRRL 30616 TaxID=1408157 RepID=A0A1J7JZH1_9PEZI|nr:hypothetical protein CONLIGDRAFT_640396 [Coniochaeta ligniaria NRRL 30616]
MSSEVFRRVGRGGAGNWYSKKDIDDADKVASEDLEAQKPIPSAATPTTASTSSEDTAAYSRAGRGGAGNFYDPKDTDEARRQEKEDSRRTNAALSSAGTSKPRTGLSGRGGVGNWSDPSTTALTKQQEKEEQERREHLEAQILQDVDAGLAPPPAAYHYQGREQEER